MGTEIIGVLIFLIIGIAAAFTWVKLASTLFTSVIGSAATVLLVVQALNFIWVGEPQLISSLQFFVAGGIPAAVTLLLFILSKKNKASS
jgi:hypothetical protein